MMLTHPAAQSYLGLPGTVYGWALFLTAVALFGYLISRRTRLLRQGQADPRFSDWAERAGNLLFFGILQKRQPRYLVSGIAHIFIFWGFVVLGLRSAELVTQGLGLPAFDPLLQSGFGRFYGSLKDVFELLVLGACLVSGLWRALRRPARYAGSHVFEAYLVLGLISFLMVSDMVYEGTRMLLGPTGGGWLPASSFAAGLFKGLPASRLEALGAWSYWLHLLAFFAFLNFLPLGKHFHIITALPNVFFRKLAKGSLKPARWGVADLEELETLGVERLTDFSWKHLLDLYTCTECGRCSDQCPAHAIGRPLSPKQLSLDLRQHAYSRYPFFTRASEPDERSLAGGVIAEPVIWSCTTCGACEEECPVFIEYIDKIVDLRRHLIESARGPKSFNPVLMNFEKTGNPFGKPASKRADWVREQEDLAVRELQPDAEVDVLFYVDSYGSFEPVAQGIAAAVARGFSLAGVDFGILGKREKDTGHQVRRIGEEGLFQLLMEENLETLGSVRFGRIVTADPHAFNTLRNDYPGGLEVCHYSEFFSGLLRQGRLKPVRGVDPADVYTFHDPCYLGRHNGVYQAPRSILASIPGLKLVEMKRSRDRSFCCGGGDVALWHEIEQEETRMALHRVRMAQEAGAGVIVTACPFCLIHFEDAIKTAGLEGSMRVKDLMQLLVSTLQTPEP